MKDANAYLRFLTTGVKDGVWSEILSTGSDETACDVILHTFIGWYPCCAGSTVYLEGKDRQPTRLYTVSIEGEQSYSGILTFDCYDPEGNRVEHCKFQVVEGEIIVLEGERMHGGVCTDSDRRGAGGIFCQEAAHRSLKIIHL